MSDISALGRKVTKFEKFDTFERPEFTTYVSMISDEVTALCPITEQPDWYDVKIGYAPNLLCLESKTLKLYLHSLREQGMFVEALATKILKDIRDVLAPHSMKVDIIQKARGGVSIIATATWEEPQ